MMLTVPFERLHYGTVAAWWRARGQNPAPEAWLSPLGLLAVDRPEGTPVAVCWLYLTGTAVCWLEGLVTNPGVPRLMAARGAEAVLADLMGIARNLGHQVVSACTEKRSVAAHLTRVHGFQPARGHVVLTRTFQIGG